MLVAVRNESPTVTLLWAARNRVGVPCIVAVDDGVQWRAERYPSPTAGLTAAGLADAPPVPGAALRVRQGVRVMGSPAMLDEREKALLKWVQKLDRSGFQTTIAQGAEAPPASRVREAPCPRIGAVRYEGWTPALARKSAHEFDALHRVVVRAVEACAAAWGWAPAGLLVSFHTSNRAMGLAYNPGAGNRRVSLATKLLALFDLESIYRTVVHELCHHAREELHPRDRSGFRGRLGALIAHDARFCEMLAQVDPLVAANPTSCQFFTDEADDSAVAAAAARRGVVFSASAGYLEVGVGPDYYPRFRWLPLDGAPVRWRASWERLTASSLAALIGRFPAADVRVLVVRWSLARRSGGVQVGSLLTFLADLARTNKSFSFLAKEVSA